jgi:hypothetical protein
LRPHFLYELRNIPAAVVFGMFVDQRRYRFRASGPPALHRSLSEFPQHSAAAGTKPLRLGIDLGQELIRH